MAAAVAPPGRNLPWALVSIVASAWFLIVFVLTKIVGPLNPDELLFSHVLWMTLEGKKQFLDFYSQHFPTYFQIYALLLPHDNGADLHFLWTVRLTNLLVLGAYIGMLFGVERQALYLLPFLLFMTFASRMIEVRPDTLGLLALNGAWFLLLSGRSTWRTILAAVLAIFAGCCSARGLVMGLGFGAALILRAAVHREWREMIPPLTVLACVLIVGASVLWMRPHYVELMLRSALLDPGAVLPRLSLAQRLVAFDRTPQVLIALIALALAVLCFIRGRERERVGVIAVASLSQFVLIFVDPSPFPYVYAWAALPTIVGLALISAIWPMDGRKWLAVAGGLGALAHALLIVSYPLRTGKEAPPLSNYRLSLDPRLQPSLVERMPTDALVALMVDREHQQSLGNQLLIRSELCRRIQGGVLAVWQNHPVCTADADYNWWSVKWPDIGDPAAPTTAWFATIFARHPPDLFIWDSGTGAPLKLNAATASLIRNYDLYPGFAINPRLRGATGNSGKAAIPQNNGRR